MDEKTDAYLAEILNQAARDAPGALIQARKRYKKKKNRQHKQETRFQAEAQLTQLAESVLQGQKNLAEPQESLLKSPYPDIANYAKRLKAIVPYAPAVPALAHNKRFQTGLGKTIVAMLTSPTGEALRARAAWIMDNRWTLKQRKADWDLLFQLHPTIKRTGIETLMTSPLTNEADLE